MSVNNTSNTSILIVEDEIAIAEGLVDLCELNGYHVKHVADGESGLSEALSNQYGLVLLDVMGQGDLLALDAKSAVFSLYGRLRLRDGGREFLGRREQDLVHDDSSFLWISA